MHVTGLSQQQIGMAALFSATVQLLVQLECVIVERDGERALFGCKAELRG